MKYSILFDTDSYKASHYLQYPENTTSLFSYVESRGGEYPETVFFGLQYYLKEYLSQPITVKEVEKANAFFLAHCGSFNYDGWMYIAKDLRGILPVRIRAVPEGSIVPAHNVLASVESTDPKVFWIASWLETSLLRSCWYGTNVATRSYTIKKLIKDALNKSADNTNADIVFKLNDFGSRGSPTQESAMVGGAAHTVNFSGSDNVVGVLCANEYYNDPMAAFSIPAAEHSSITSWGKENEVEAYRNMLKRFAKPGALVACVSDSYDLWNAVSNLWGGELRQEVIDSGATIIIRPDSGNPPEVVSKTAELLDEKFGHTLNSKGYKVLNYVRIIQGDGINEYSIKEILDTLLSNGYSATNIAFGMGGALLQQHNRDTNKFALKCSHIFVGDKSVDVYKDPITDPGKVSKAGRLDLIYLAPKTLKAGKETVHLSGSYQTVKLYDGNLSHSMSAMRTIYEDGKLLVDDTLADIRARAKI
jgi:nicotinamide phosphoribosyltransferase